MEEESPETVSDLTVNIFLALQPGLADVHWHRGDRGDLGTGVSPV